MAIVNQINKKMSCGAPPYFSRWITKKMGLSYVISAWMKKCMIVEGVKVMRGF